MITIAPASPADLPAILDLLSQHGLPHAGLADHLGTALIARDGEAVVGSAALECYEDVALLRSMAVATTRRGQGLGQLLTSTALDRARQRGIHQIYLLTTTAESFFPRFGFSRITRDVVAPAVQVSAEFTGACPSSAIVMVCELE